MSWISAVIKIERSETKKEIKKRPIGFQTKEERK